LSRKKTIGNLTGRADPHERVHGSVAAHVIAAQRGAKLLRVRDVAATVDALAVWNAVGAQPAPRPREAAPAIRWPDEDEAPPSAAVSFPGPPGEPAMTASTPLLVTFSAYLLLMVGIGFVAWRSTRDFDDYILGGRSLGGYVTALSAGASDMSGWLLMGLPGALYLSGASEAWIAIGLIVGAWFNWRFVAGPLRVYTEHSENALTLPDYFTT